MPKEAKNKDKKQKEKKEKKHFLKDVKAELKKVIWPTPKQLFNNTLAVIVIVLIVGAIVFVLDVCFEKMNSFGIDKLKQAVEQVQVNEIANEVTNSTDETNVEGENAASEEGSESQENVENSTEENSEQNNEEGSNE